MTCHSTLVQFIGTVARSLAVYVIYVYLYNAFPHVQ